MYAVVVRTQDEEADPNAAENKPEEDDDHGDHTHSYTMNTEDGTATFESHLNEDELPPLYSSHPDICAKIKNVWGPVLLAKVKAHQEANLFNSAGALSQDLENKMEQHKKVDHNHFNCHEAKDLFSMTSAKELMAVFRTIFDVPVKGHTGETVVQLIREMQQELQNAGLLGYDSYNEFEEVLKDMEIMNKQYVTIKADFDAVMSESRDCTTNFQNFMKEILDLTHEELPNWEHLEWGVEQLKEQCTPTEEL